MKHVPIRLGPLALLMTVIAICLAVLGILTFSTARADLSLAERYAETVQTRYALEVEGQTFLCSAAPGETAVFEQDGMKLSVALDGNGDVAEWVFSREWVENDTVGTLWPGN